MLIKTKCLCKAGHQKCLAKGFGANEVYLPRLPIKVMFRCSFLLEGKKNESGKQTPQDLTAY